MSIHIAIVEDEKANQELLKHYLSKYQKEIDEKLIVSIYSDGDEILDAYDASYDIVLLDIEMKRLDGMITAERIRKIDQEVIIIFITNMAQYAVKGYAVNALSYLLKPVDYFAFKQELNRSIERIVSNKDHFLLIPASEGTIKLSVTSILYLESIKHHVIIHTVDKKTYTLNSTLKAFEKKLIKYDYYRINSCYLVNLAKVSGIKQEFAYINNHELKISRPRKKGFKEALTKYLGGF